MVGTGAGSEGSVTGSSPDAADSVPSVGRGGSGSSTQTRGFSIGSAATSTAWAANPETNPSVPAKRATTITNNAILQPLEPDMRFTPTLVYY